MSDPISYHQLQQQKQTTFQTPPPQPQQAAQQQGGAAVPSRAVSLEEIVKLFHLPIADAAGILGVCTSVLKKICRDNGIVRWPYRKVLAGKTLEDIKKEAAIEKELSKAAKQRMDPSASLPSNFSIQLQGRTASHSQDTSKLPGHVSHQQGNKLLQIDRTNTFQSTHPRTIPNYNDEFKYGFPANGLASATNKWWGTSGEGNKGNDLQSKTGPGEQQQRSELPKGPDGDEKHDNKTENSSIESEPASSLASLRKRAVKDGYESLRLGVSRGYGPYKLSKRERSMLLQVFQSSLPSQWKYSFS